ncbi:MAG: C25 family peptidase propeptide domain-containing protein [Bacteroidia bacterium]
MKFITTGILSVICFSAVAQQSRIQIISSSPEKTVLKVSVTGFDWKTVQTAEGTAKVISLENGVQMNKPGAPDLPKLMTMVPFASPDVKIETEFVSYTDFDNMNVALTAPKTVDVDDDNSDFRKHENYSSDEFFPRRVVRKKKQKFLNDGSLLLAIRPVQYNGATKTVRLWNELVITITPNTTAQVVSVPETAATELTVYPNPSLDILTVSYELESQSTVSLDVYNLAGQTVYSKNKGTQAACLQTTTLDVSDFAPGMYSLALRTDKGTTVKRVVVE